MKNYIIALILFFSVSVSAQSAFDRFESQDAVTSVVVTKKMFELMGNIKMDGNDKSTQQYLNLVKKLDNLKVFTTSNNKAIADMRNTVESYLKSNPLEELMRINDSGKNVKIYVKQGSSANQVRELLMFIDNSSRNEDTVLMSLTGNFSLDEISVLTDQMKIPGGNELKKAANKK